MKKAIILAAMLALPTLAGQKLIYTTPAPVPTAPPPAAGWGLEIAYTYSWAACDIYKDWVPCKEIRSNGVDLTGVYNFNAHHAATLRLAYAFGARSWSDDVYFDGHEIVSCYDRVRMHTFSLMPGYRYTLPLCPHSALYAGVNAGVANQSVKDNYHESNYGVDRNHKSAWGFAYTAEVGLRINLCQDSEFFVAYHFTGNTARTKNNGYITHRQTTHGIRTGFGFRF